LAFALSLLGLLVAALQAYIFTMLSALYFGSAVEELDHH
jgi:F-type H+-transporting ATPase subunit a